MTTTEERPKTSGREKASKRQPALGPLLIQVNLLPPEVRAARGLRVVKRWLGGLVVLSVVLAGGLVGFAMLQQANARAALEEAQAETARLQAEQAQYAEVPEVLGALDRTKLAREVGMGTEVLWAPYLSAIAATAPEGVSVDIIGVKSTTPMEIAAVPADPLQDQSVGTITFTADSLTVPDTAAWLDGLVTVPGFADAWFSAATITETDGTAYYTVNATVQFDTTAYALRFAPQEEE